MMSIQSNATHGREGIANPIWTDQQRVAIQEELNRVLADSAFKSSKRCQSMLIRLVEYALAADHDGIKERTLGVEVFGRDLNYDTSADPIVRITANEIRKRLAQWYSEPDVHHPVRIRLIPGTYLPKFDFDFLADTPEPDEDKLVAEAIEHQPAAHPEETPRSWSSNLRWGWILAGVAALLVVAAAVTYMRTRTSENPNQYAIWTPLIKPQNYLTFCISDEEALFDADGKTSTKWQVIADTIAKREVPRSANRSGPTSQTPMIDAYIASKVINWVALRGQKANLMPSSALKFENFRSAPIVLIGGYNPWSLILLSDLRYSLRVDPVTHEKWIQDAQNPANRDWKLSGNADHIDVDYALITRYFDTETGQWIISLGGLWSYGTAAAGNLLTEPAYENLQPAVFRSTKNLQVVLKTKMVNGNPGAPQVIAVYSW